MNKRDARISRLQEEQSTDTLRLLQLVAPRQGRMGRHPEPMRDFMIYHQVNVARLMRMPKHPGLKPVPLSWEKAYAVVAQALSKKDERNALISLPMSDGTVETMTTSISNLGTAFGMGNKNISNGAIRAAYARGKKIGDVVQRIGIRLNQIKALSEKPAKKS